MRALASLSLALLLAAPVAAVCNGDCNGDGAVAINELVTGVGIALGQSPVAACTAVDGNGDGEVTISELIAAANALLSGCPVAATPTVIVATATATATAIPSDTPTSSPTVSESPTPSATPTATANLPPALPSPVVYRGIAGQPIARPLGAVDPEGDSVTCAADALLAGMTLDSDNVLRWTPAADQLGPIDVPITCQDASAPPQTASGELAFRITPPDNCAPATCDPATGCTETTLPLGELCCEGHQQVRLPEAEVFCPEGRILEIGQNALGFGPLQSCDQLRFIRRAQTSASLRFHIRVTCLNFNNRLTVTGRLDSPVRGLLAEGTFKPLPVPPPDGEPYTRRGIEIPFTQNGPYLNIEDTEANLTVSVQDADGAEITRTLRVILTSNPVADRPDP